MSAPLPPLTLNDFDAFFAELNDGFEPFPWQRRLARRVAEGLWPAAIALPTSSGKTACIDIAIFALAYQSGRKEPRIAPLRIFFVIDRRVVVNAAFEHAKQIAAKLCGAGNADGVLQRVAARLRHVGGLDPDQHPLTVHELRGGVYRDDDWVRTPCQPSVIASTVDQVGSRLLFRGYGLRGGYADPLHAGLTAYDSLILLDEAHCSNPFRETLEAVQLFRGESWCEQPLSAPLQVALLSATLPADISQEEEKEEEDGKAKKVFELEVEDHDHPVLGRRLRASKPARLIEAKNRKDAVAFTCEEEAQRLLDDGRRRIAVIVNRVATAKETANALLRKVGERADVFLLTGRMRAFDREWYTPAIERRIQARRNDSAEAMDEKPIIVVATQCVEVGADYDFDAMVTECASLDALRQRFGRLDRLGHAQERDGQPAESRIVIDPKQTAVQDKLEKQDPIYGNALPATWAWLNEKAEAGEDGPVVDMGVQAFRSLLPPEVDECSALLEQLNAPAPHAPVMLPAHVDFWAQTSPRPAPDPDVSLFLHGTRPTQPEIQVVWRADLDPEAVEQWADIVALCPPVAAECLSVPMGVFRRWLLSKPGDATEAISDIEGVAAVDTNGREHGVSRSALLWRPPDDCRPLVDVDAIRPGDTIVLPVTDDESPWNILGFVPTSLENEESPADGAYRIDIAEQARLASPAAVVSGKPLSENQSRRIPRRPVLRLHPRLLRCWPDSEWKKSILDHEQLAACAEDRQRLREQLQALDENALPGRLRTVFDTICKLSLDDAVAYPSDDDAMPAGLVVQAGGRDARNGAAGAAFTHEDDSSSALDTGPALVPLFVHCRGVADFAERFARTCGLSDAMVADFRLAGQLHDLGKADPRFQAWLYGGNRLLADGALLVAKSRAITGATARRRARERSGYPKGGRHELLSVTLVESCPELLIAAADPDLVLHLIAAHHGRCRPLAPYILDDQQDLDVRLEHGERTLLAPAATRLERLDSGVAERFWRLVRRYGWWGLAWLESIFILADHRRSEWEQANPDAIEKEAVSCPTS